MPDDVRHSPALVHLGVLRPGVHPIPLAAAGLLLVAVLAVAVVRPRMVPEAAASVPAAVLAVLTGLLPWRLAVEELAALGPTVGFLAAILLLGHLAAGEGVFTAAGSVMARASRTDPRRLLGLVFAIGAVVTAVLSLDATVVLLTPVVFATVRKVGVTARPHVYACTHLANAGSLPLPVSNLTNLLVCGAVGLTFTHFALLMTGPWLAALAVEYVAFRWFFRDELPPTRHPRRRGAAGVRPGHVPVFALVTLGSTLVGFAVSSPLGIGPVWPAVLGAVTLGARALVRRRTTTRRLVMAASPGFCVFVLGLGVTVRAVQHAGLDRLVEPLLPVSAGLAALLAMAAVAAVLANLVNNLPAVLVLAQGLAGHPHAPGLLLAALIGVNVGPNLTYVGRWRRCCGGGSCATTTPSRSWASSSAWACSPCRQAVTAGAVALWASIRVFGA
ncbi:SLC13 family permease [Actinomadura sp. HBU206391]|uniref:SLC13 family permease n=1 Tax=Actinomadura sp. HBU206391 TaxID=2731692 RepID=UPI001C9C2962|nr:SLC13 family permease [Actinomadura sp. HBU206391]